MQWLVIDTATQSVLGWTRSGKATEMPQAPEGRSFVEATDEMIQAVEDARRDAAGRGVHPILTDKGVGLPPDTRPRIRIEADRSSAEVGEDVTLTATMLDNPRFTGSQVVEGLGGRLLRFNFVDGVATRVIKLQASGRFEIASTRDVVLESKLDLTGVE